MRNKVDTILNIVKNVYSRCSELFHEYFIREFKSSVISMNLHNKKLLEFDEESFCKFIDDCIMYRLGLTIKEPKASDIIYNLSESVNPEIYTESLDDILEKLIYSALPQNLVNQIKSRIESYDLDENVVNLIISKLE